eukprot:m.198674 g.198674  ORF g.198674 m.198674 type:complete len:128 (+) comp14922_c1_seq1:218-601(+)
MESAKAHQSVANVTSLLRASSLAPPQADHRRCKSLDGRMDETLDDECVVSGDNSDCLKELEEIYAYNAKTQAGGHRVEELTRDGCAPGEVKAMCSPNPSETKPFYSPTTKRTTERTQVLQFCPIPSS